MKRSAFDDGPEPVTATTQLLSSREIVVPHTPGAGPVTAVRNVLIQSSLATLRANGYYHRYEQLIAPTVLEQLLASVGPGWLPIALADAHYAACDSLMLTQDELAKLGTGVGARVQETTLVSSAKRSRPADFDLWSLGDALHRMWARHYQGGSVQVMRAGPCEKLLEMRGFSLTRHRYFRYGMLMVIAVCHKAVAPITAAKIESYSPKTNDLVVRVSWS